MARRTASWAMLIYLLFIAVIYWYIFYGTSADIPSHLKGTSADPSTFMNSRELDISTHYSKIRNFMFFLAAPYDWIFYLFIMLAGFPGLVERWSRNLVKWTILQNGIYLFWVSVLAFLFTLPLDFIGFRLSKSYHLSNQTFPLWMKDELIGFWVDFALMWVVMSVLYWLIRRFTKKWWLYAWLLSIPFTLFLMFIQPVVIDPLYNKFYPLQDQKLEKKILALAAKADIPAEHVYEVNMSTKTNSMNAYVNGIGSNSRIVLWDTTLNKLSDKEILFIMAHEMGHYVEKHLYFGIAGSLAGSFIGLWIASKLVAAIIRRWGGLLKIPSIKSLSSYPLLLLTASVLLFAASPVSNYAARYEEKRADIYAIKMTKDKEAGIHSFQELTRSGLSQVNPPLLVKLFRYTHPTMLERISMIENWPAKK
ncbi:M48 family metallopeptidase [Peribacillus kribbensis]|uniref:M48 family metallopeptidase n=1 Tax=Peribacillus kribbensis TaxID=356658 RepID=UPI000422C4A2|nr:M48 family metallopeptidase [Peribacillus kribbensis]